MNRDTPPNSETPVDDAAPSPTDDATTSTPATTGWRRVFTDGWSVIQDHHRAPQKPWSWKVLAVALTIGSLVSLVATVFFSIMDLIRPPHTFLPSAQVVRQGVGLGLVFGLLFALAPTFRWWVARERNAKRRIAIATGVAVSLWVVFIVVFGVDVGFDPYAAASYPVLIVTLAAAVYQAVFPTLQDPTEQASSDATHVYCARCEYERPAERTDHNERCPECGNFWWAPPSYAIIATHRGNYQGIRLTKRRSTPVRKTLVGVAIYGFFSLPLFAPITLVFDGTYRILPNFMLRQIASDPADFNSGGAIQELLLNRGLSAAEQEAIVLDLIAWRDERKPINIDALIAIDILHAAGQLDPAIAERWASGSVLLEASADVAADGRSLIPKLHAVVLSSPWDLKAHVTWTGVSINGGAWQQVLPSPTRPELIATTYEDFTASWATGAPVTQAANPSHTPHFQPITFGDPLPPGEHTVTIRVTLEQAPAFSAASGGQAYQMLARHITPPAPSAGGANFTWSETRDLEVTVRVPDRPAN